MKPITKTQALKMFEERYGSVENEYYDEQKAFISKLYASFDSK